MTKKQGGESEDEFSVDEPEELQESDDDWTPSSSDVRGRRQSTRLRRTKRSLVEVDDDDDEEEEEEEEEDDSDDDRKRRGGRRGRGGKASGGRPPVKRKATAPVVVSEATSTTPLVEKEFSAGAFIVAKSDFEAKNDPPLWKIDGKALLQKYIPFELDGKTLYKNTATYSGWSIHNKDNYYPAPITYKTQNKKEVIVEFLKNEIKVSPAQEEDEESE